MTADTMAWTKQPERYWTKAPQDVAKLPVDWMGPFHEGREWLQRDEAQRSIGMAELINRPEDHVMGPMVAIGKGTKQLWPKPGQLALEELVVEDGF